MANIYGRSTATFKPYSFEEMLKPALMATEAYEKADAQLNALLEDAAIKGFNFAPQDIEEKAKYDLLTQKLQNAANELISTGSSKAMNDIRDVNKVYRKEMIPIQQKLAKRAELVAEQRKLKESGKNIEFDIDYSTAPLSIITSNSTFNPIFIDDILDRTKKATLDYINGQPDKQVGKPKKINGTNSYSVIIGKGYTQDEYNDAINDPTSELSQFRNTQIQKALAGVPKNNEDLIDRIIANVDNTIKNNIGQFKMNTVTGSTSKIDLDDLFKYTFDEKGNPTGYRESYIEGQLRMKGYQKDKDGKYTIPPAHLNPDGTIKTPQQTFVEEHRLFTSPVYIETDDLRNALVPEEERYALKRNWKEIERSEEIKHIKETTVPITIKIDNNTITTHPINFDNLPEHSRLRDLINKTVGFKDIAYYKYGYDVENHRLVIIPIDYDVEKTKSTEIKVDNITPAPTPQPTPTPEVPKKPDTSNS